MSLIEVTKYATYIKADNEKLYSVTEEEEKIFVNKLQVITLEPCVYAYPLADGCEATYKVVFTTGLTIFVNKLDADSLKI